MKDKWYSVAVLCSLIAVEGFLVFKGKMSADSFLHAAAMLMAWLAPSPIIAGGNK